MDFQSDLLRLVSETFTEPELLDIALYVISAQSVAEAAQYGIMDNLKEVKGLPPQALEIAYKYDSALTNNEFFLKHFSLIKAFTVMDKIRLSSIGKLISLAEKEKTKPLYKASYLTMYAKFDALAMLAFLWKGYDFAVEFMSKLRMVMKLPDYMEKYFEERM